jgi:type IVB pilus formation R64 PilN family outer membrane protein
MLKKWIVFVFVAAFMLSACNSPVYNQTENNVADVKIKTKAARQKSDDSAKVASSLVMDKGLYVDKTPISLYRNPSWLKDHIVIKGDQLPFSYYSRSLAQGAGYGILTKYQVGMDQTTRVSLNYSGTVQGALDLLASKSGYVYSIEGKTIYWQAFLTKTYDIAFMPGGSDYLMGKKSGTGGAAGGGAAQTQNFTTSDSSADQYSNMGGKLSVWTDLQTTVNQLLSPDGKATVSQATTSVTVRDRPTNLALVSQYISNLNSKLSRQVLVKIQILQVDLRNDYDMGINWQIIARSFHNSPFVLNGNYGTPISITSFMAQSSLPAGIAGTSINPPTVPQFGTVGNGGVPSYTILFNALNQQGKTSVVTEPRVVALNNQVSVIKITEQKGYVASIQNTTLGSASTNSTAATSTVTSQVTPGNIITGITLYILPKIMNGKIYMQVNADLSVNTDLQTFGATGSQIQLPTVASKSFNQRGVIRSGETLILSGFRQLVNNARATQLMKSQALGGKASTQTSSETVVLITPIILDGSV